MYCGKLLLYARLTAAENATIMTAGVSQLVPNTVSIIFSTLNEQIHKIDKAPL